MKVPLRDVAGAGAVLIVLMVSLVGAYAATGDEQAPQDAQAPADLPSLEEVITRCFAASGGEAVIAALVGVSVKEEFRAGDLIEGRIELHATGNKRRLYARCNSREFVVVFEGDRLVSVQQTPFGAEGCHCGDLPHLLLMHLRSGLRHGRVVGRRDFMREAAIAVQPRTGSDMYYFSAADGRLLGADTDGPGGNRVVTQFLDWKPLGDALVYTKIQRAAATPDDEYESTIRITWERVDPSLFEPPSTSTDA